MSVNEQMKRRRFLQGMAGAGALAAMAPSRGWAWDSKSPNERPVFATIGLRNQGVVISEQALEVTDIAALADVDANVLGSCAEKLSSGRQAKPFDLYKDYRAILDRQDIDAVMIATPDHWHTKIAVEAMLAGKDVYCEKPLTLTIDEGKLIERVVEQTGRVFQVGTMQRSIDRFLTAVAIVREGRIGEIKKLTVGLDGLGGSPPIPVAAAPEGLDWDFWLGPAPRVEYRALPELREGYGGGVPLFSNGHYSFRHWHAFSGGKMTDWGAHHVDIACWAIGLETGPRKITPLNFELPVEHKDGYPVVADRYNAATSYDIRVELPDGVEMTITSKPDNGILFEGTKGRIFVNRGRLTGKPVEDLEQNPLPEGAVERVYGGPVSRNHVANLIEGMATRKQPISDVWSHNRMLEICHLSNIAMRLNRPVEWDATKREIIADEQANSFLSREYRSGYEIEM